MSVVVSLLRAIDRADGEALVMHVGEKPYVVTATGHAELAAKALTIPAMTGMLDQLLPPESRRALDELGAVEYHLPPDAAAPGISYSVVAARGGDDIWIELRRRKEAPGAEAIAATPSEPVIERAAPPLIESVIEPVSEAPQPMIAPTPDPVLERFGEPAVELDAPVDLPMAPEPEPAFQYESVVVQYESVVVQHEPPEPAAAEPDILLLEETAAAGPAPAEEERAGDAFELTATTEATPFEVPGLEDEHEDVTLAPGGDVSGPRLDFSATVEVPPAAAEPEAAPEPELDVEAETEPEPEIEPEPEPTPAVVVPIARANMRVEHPPRVVQQRAEGLQHLLRLAAAQGASALYVAPQAKPSLRVDGEIRVLDEAPLSEAQLQAGLLAIAPRTGRGAFPLGEAETYDVPEVGRVQCLGFRDHRGLGAMFKMLPARAISAEHIGLSAAVQALCTEPEGLVLVAGARGAGKSTLVAALVDQINRTRRDHVITVESQIQFVHENRSSFVSQREARDEETFAETVRSALRETPDVMVIDQVASAEVATFALHAAANGHLVVASLTASTTASALGRFVEFFGEDRAQARLTLSEHLRGIVTQTLLRKTGGGRAAAREVLVNVPSVSSLVAEGQFEQLVAILNGGRRVGMVPLNDALLGLVQSGALDVREAYRKSPDQQELIAMLNRAGLDTTFAERLTGS